MNGRRAAIVVPEQMRTMSHHSKIDIERALEGEVEECE